MHRLTLSLAMIFGFVNVALAQPEDLMLEWNPVYNTVNGTIELRGSANIAGQQWFYVEAAPYEAGADAIWTPVTSFSFVPVINDALGAWDTSILNDGFYQIRLHAVNSEQESVYYAVGPVAVNNDGGIINTEAVQVLAAPAAPLAFKENRLPLPVGGHVQEFDAGSSCRYGFSWHDLGQETSPVRDF